MPDNTNGQKVALVTCAGGHNVSLIAFNVARKLEKEGYGRYLRLSGGKNPEQDTVRLKEAAPDVTRWLVIDGCPQGCAKAALEKAGLQPDSYVVVTGLGIKQEMSTDYSEEDLVKTLEEVKRVYHSS